MPTKTKLTKQSSGLSGYLVVMRQRIDDLPIAFFADRKEAIRFAANTDDEPTAEIRRVFDDVYSTTVSIAIIEFADGYPVKVF